MNETRGLRTTAMALTAAAGVVVSVAALKALEATIGMGTATRGLGPSPEAHRTAIAFAGLMAAVAMGWMGSAQFRSGRRGRGLAIVAGGLAIAIAGQALLAATADPATWSWWI